MSVIAERPGVNSRDRAGGEAEEEAAAPHPGPLRDCQRVTGAGSEDAGDVPAADQLVEKSIRRAEPLALPERQFIEPRRIELVRDVERRRPVLGVQAEAVGEYVRAVLNLAELVERAGEGVVDRIEQPLRQTLAQRDEQCVVIRLADARTQEERAGEEVVEGLLAGQQPALVNGQKDVVDVAV